VTQRFNRRELLRIGGSGAMGISLTRLLAAEELPAPLAPRADALIVLFLNGGPSHLDMWDMKPEGPVEIRGEFKPISSSLAGIPVCEHLPRLATHLHRCTLVRAMHHSVNNAHAMAVYTALTGHDRGDANRAVGESSEDWPALGAVAARLRPTAADVVSHVALPYMTKEGAGGPPQPGFFGGWLGDNFDPLWVLRDPNAPDFSVPELSLPADVDLTRFASRGELLDQLRRGRMNHDARGLFDSMSRFQHRAFDVLTSRRVKEAFRLDQEPDPVRTAYGRNIYGQSVLLARRLVEAGTRVATISWAPDANATWDTHGGNFKKLKNPLLPQFDAAFASLMQDLVDRQMLDRTLVAVLGDFGRTPKINGNDAGRDHWNYCYTILLAGGGIRPGLVYGASDKSGAFPADKPTTPGDIIATIYRLLGIPPQCVLYDRFGRPHQVVPQGAAVEGILA
jgi:hypothetical protein